MIIDFHTHIFPEKIAAATLEKLRGFSGIEPDTEGTEQSLRESMHKNGIDVSVVLPVVTAPKQFDSINRFALEINGKDGLVSFGGIHPDCDDLASKLHLIKEAKLCGVKIHPDYQGTDIDDDRYAEILDACVREDLYLITHAGFDCVSPQKIHCTPDGVKRLLFKVYGESVPKKRHLILAHCGGNRLWDEVETKLCGAPVYFDLACMIRKIEPERLLRIIRSHGAENILFASDSPWSSPSLDLEALLGLGLDEDELSLILWRNAANMLKIKHLK